jgi:hypothetical protein
MLPRRGADDAGRESLIRWRHSPATIPLKPTLLAPALEARPLSRIQGRPGKGSRPSSPPQGCRASTNLARSILASAPVCAVTAAASPPRALYTCSPRTPRSRRRRRLVRRLPYIIGASPRVTTKVGVGRSTWRALWTRTPGPRLHLLARGQEAQFSGTDRHDHDGPTSPIGHPPPPHRPHGPRRHDGAAAVSDDWIRLSGWRHHCQTTRPPLVPRLSARIELWRRSNAKPMLSQAPDIAPISSPSRPLHCAYSLRFHYLQFLARCAMLGSCFDRNNN